MLIIGYDPGVHCGWALLEKVGLRPRFVRGGVLDGRDAVGLVRHLESQARTTFVGLETIEGYAHERKRSKDLIAAAHIAGDIEGAAIAHAFRVFRAPAVTWRSYIGVGPNGSDAAIKSTLRILVADLPTLTNVHLRDAVGTAFYVAQTHAMQTRLARGVA